MGYANVAQFVGCLRGLRLYRTGILSIPGGSRKIDQATGAGTLLVHSGRTLPDSTGQTKDSRLLLTCPVVPKRDRIDLFSRSRMELGVTGLDRTSRPSTSSPACGNHRYTRHRYAYNGCSRHGTYGRRRLSIFSSSRTDVLPSPLRGISRP